MKKKIFTFILSVITLFALTVTSFAYELPKSLIPGGEVIGLNVKSSGVIVVGIPENTDASQPISPAGEAGLMTGDIIIRVNGKDVQNGLELRTAIEEASGDVTLHFLRNGKLSQKTLTPIVNSDGARSIGIWARDTLSGIGTVTYYDPESETYGALGHAIADSDSKTAFPLKSGEVYEAEISSIVKGSFLEPGELHGEFEKDEPVGSVESNTVSGIFGEIYGQLDDEKTIPIASGSEVREGEAKLICTLDGEGKREYAINIDKVFSGDDGEAKNFLISVTDSELIAKTGGIVQGMSGSPIIQNGKLIGAVTHVLTQDPTKGYGIFITRMLESSVIDKAA